MTIEEINLFCKNTLIENLGIQFTEFLGKTIEATMPVNEKTIQPMGYLHGGASLALAESVASAGSLLNVDPKKFTVFGMQVSGNHVSSINKGEVVAKAVLIHRGGTSHVWDVRIEDKAGKLISTSRVTNAIVKIKEKA